MSCNHDHHHHHEHNHAGPCHHHHVPTQRDVTTIRLKKEIELLKEHSTNYNIDFHHDPEKHFIIVNKILRIDYGKNFPFIPPQLTFDLKYDKKYKDCYCLYDLN